VMFSGAHDASMRALLNGHVDAIAAFDMAREQYLTDKAERERIIVVAETQPIPEAGIAARSGLDPAVFKRVQEALFKIRAPEHGHDLPAVQPRAPGLRDRQRARRPSGLRPGPAHAVRALPARRPRAGPRVPGPGRPGRDGRPTGRPAVRR